MRLDLLWPRNSRMASCFDFRVRTSSFDLHRLTQRHKLARIGRLFRSRSDTNVKSDSSKSSPKNSPVVSPKGSPNNPKRRRFVRVVKNAESVGEEYENPHIIRRYTQEYVQEQWSQQRSSSFDDGKLPYQVEGHTILKRHSSGESGSLTGGEQSPVQKHASFNEDVEVIEFDHKEKVIIDCPSHVERLHIGEEDSISEMPEFCPFCVEQDRIKTECPHSSDSEQSDTETSSQNKAKKQQLLRKHVHVHQQHATHHPPMETADQSPEQNGTSEYHLQNPDNSIKNDTNPAKDVVESPNKNGNSSKIMQCTSVQIVQCDVVCSTICEQDENSVDCLIENVSNTHISAQSAETGRT